MKISWYGQSLFQITDRIKKKKIRVVINPFNKEDTGLKPPRLKTDILLCSNKDNHNLKVAKGKKYFLIDGPGEYETKGVFIQGVPTFEFKKKKGEKKPERSFDNNVIYTISINNIKICHLGDLQQKELKENQLDQMGMIDVLMVPVGGNNTIDTEEATDIINQIEPAIIIPMHYAVPKLKMKLDSLDKFLKLVKAEKIKPKKSVKIHKKDIDYDKPKTIILKK